MYDFLLRRYGEGPAYWGTLLWYALLITIVSLSFFAPAGEFRYGNI